MTADSIWLIRSLRKRKEIKVPICDQHKRFTQRRVLRVFNLWICILNLKLIIDGIRIHLMLIRNRLTLSIKIRLVSLIIYCKISRKSRGVRVRRNRLRKSRGLRQVRQLSSSASLEPICKIVKRISASQVQHKVFIRMNHKTKIKVMNKPNETI